MTHLGIEMQESLPLVASSGTMTLIAATTVCITGLWMLWHKHFERPVAHIATGVRRRSLFPVAEPFGPGAQQALADKNIIVHRMLFTLRCGAEIFYQTLQPVGRAPSHVVFFLHGYMSHTDMHLENAVKFTHRGALVVMMDLPGHGRSDGLLYYVADWWNFVQNVWEFIEGVVIPLRKKVGAESKLFAVGTSLGGGLATCLAVQRSSFFDGLILLAPMLFVSDEIKPSKIVQQIFNNALGPLQLTFPLTPGGQMDGLDFEHPAQGRAWTAANAFPMSLRTRLATAKSLGLTFPEWLEERLSELETAFIVLHSREDKVTDPNMSERLYTEAKAKDKTLKLFDDGFHCELFYCNPGHAKLIGMEWTPEQVERTDQTFREVFEWMATRL